MPRFTDPRRITGDTDRADLVDLGKRLLGYLAEQRRLSGVKTLSIQRTTPDGSVVRARFVGDLPSIEVIAGGGGRVLDVNLIEGFVTLPHDGAVLPAGNTDVVVLGAPPHVPGYFDATLAPAPPQRWFRYDKNGIGEPQFPNGLQLAGNVDWRNTDETLVVSWFGPSDRYFTTSFPTYDLRVFHKGTLLVDISTIDAVQFPEFAGYTGYVMGAAIRGRELLVICWLEAADRKHLLLSIPLSVSGPARQRSIPIALAPTVTADLSMARVLWSETLSAHRMLHESTTSQPWFFNGSATQAKRLYTSSTEVGTNPCIVEETLNTTDLEAVSVSRVESLFGGQGNESVTGLTFAGLGYRPGTLESEGDPTPVTVSSTIDGPRDEPNVIGSLLATAGTVSVSGVSDVVPLAVDYRGDVAVYAFWGGGAGNSASLTFDMTDLTLSPLDSFHDSYTDAANYTWHDRYNDSFDWTAAYTAQTLSGRLILPSETIECSSTQTVSNHLSGTATKDTTVTMVAGVRTVFSYGVEVPVDAQPDWSRTIVHDEVRVRRSLKILYLDLRTDTVLTAISSSTRETQVTFNEATNVAAVPSTTNQSHEASVTARLAVGGVEVATSTATHPASSVPVDTGPFHGFVPGYEGAYYALSTPFDVDTTDQLIVDLNSTVQTDGTVQVVLSAFTPLAALFIDDSRSVSLDSYAFPDVSEDTLTTTGTTLPSFALGFQLDAESGATLAWMTTNKPWRHNANATGGAVATFRGNLAAATAWPIGDMNTPAYLNKLWPGLAPAAAIDLTTITGVDVEQFSPLWVLPPTEYARGWRS